MSTRFVRETLKSLKRRVFRSASEKDGHVAEKQEDHYDEMYSRSLEYRLPYPRSRYYFVWTVLVDRLRRARTRHVLEVGCGTGQLAEFLVDSGVEQYTGFDFSATAVGMAIDKGLPRAQFLVDDARSSELFQKLDYDAIVCTEVLEHIEHDLAVVSQFTTGVRCLCTVPDFPFKSHVRHFASADEVLSRYARFFNDVEVTRLRRPESSASVYYILDGVRNDRRL